MIYKLKLTNLIKILLALCSVLSIVGLAFNIYNIIAFDSVNYSILGAVIVCVLSLLLLVLCIAILVFSCYFIKANILRFRFGFFIIKYKIDDVLAIVIDGEKAKLFLVFGDKSVANILIDKKYFDSFSKEIKNINNKIIINQKLD